MELEPQPPPVQTLTLVPTPLPNPKKPPDPSIFTLFPGKPLNRALDNPFKDADPEVIQELQKCSLRDTVNEARVPFSDNHSGLLVFNGNCLGKNISSEVFNSAATLVTAALEQGYYHKREPTPLSATNWANLACSLLAAVGRGYCCQYSDNKNSTMEKVRAEATDPNPLGKKFPTLFHRLTATVEHLQTHLAPDHEEYSEWYSSLVDTFNKKATKAAAVEVEEKWRIWKADEIDRRAADQEAEIAAAVRSRNMKYFFDAAASLGLKKNPQLTTETSCSTSTTGRKRMILGSTPRSGATKIDAIMLDSPSATLRGWRPAMAGPSKPRTDPSPSPLPKKNPMVPQASISLSPKVTLNLGPRKNTPPTPPTTGHLDINSITAAIHAAMGPAIRSVMAPYAARIEALECTTMPSPPSPMARNSQEQQSTQGNTIAPQPSPPSQPEDEEEFTLVTRKGKSRKKHGGTIPVDQSIAQLTQPTTTPTSFANMATSAAHIQQPKAKGTKTNPLPTITEVRVLRTGGHVDPLKEEYICSQAADAIAHEVRLRMTKLLVKPIPLQAGR